MLLEGRGAAEVQALLAQANQSVEQYNGSQGQKEHLRVSKKNEWEEKSQHK